MTQHDFDVVIIGGGPAGLSSALWCSELGLSALLLESGDGLGGQLNRVFNPIENHLGVSAENGKKLLDIFLTQIETRDFERKMNSEVSAVDLEAGSVKLLSGEDVNFLNLIIATGVRRRTLDVPGIEDFIGRGILFSGKRDGESVRNKSVVVAGGGDAAFENALILAETADKVVLIHRSSKFRAREEFVTQVSSHPKIQIRTAAEITKVLGNKALHSLEIRDSSTGNTSILETDALLVRIGVVPNTELFSGKLKLDAGNYIVINDLCETSMPRIFAVGDVSNPVSPTVSSAVGAGATAVKTIAAKYSLSC
ncbi:MAG: NAD(P)/FAD-dependent oxidoreductase [Pyrinomonadaceae bacterium]